MPTPEPPRLNGARRDALRLAGATGFSVLWPWASGQPAPRTVRIVARRFKFEPDLIELKQGERVVLEFDATEVMMGFNLHALGLRADLPPGKLTSLALTATAVGEFPFYCDVFCGSGHEEMDGLLRVVA